MAVYEFSSSAFKMVCWYKSLFKCLITAVYEAHEQKSRDTSCTEMKQDRITLIIIQVNSFHLFINEREQYQFLRAESLKLVQI